MNVLLVRPRPADETIGLQHVMRVEPLELEVLAGTVSFPDTVAIVDLALEEAPFGTFLERYRPDVLGVTGYITNVPEMKRLCREARARRPGVVTVVGGVHVEVCPEDLDDPAVDYRAVRNGALAFRGLLPFLRGEAPLPAGLLRPGERVDRAALPPFDWTFLPPRRDLVERYRRHYFYIFHDRVALVKASFGCPYPCRFCFCREITAHHYHERPVDEVLDELAALPEREIYLVDDDFLVSRERVLAFVEGLRQRRIDKHFLVYGRADFIARNEDAVVAFRDAGLRTVIVGFESFSDADLAAWNKGTSVAVNEAAMGVLRRLGLDCFATIILPPHWSREDFATCGRRMRELGIRYVNLQPLTPLPGTGMEVPAEQLLVSRTEYEKWDLAHVMIRPEKMSVEAYYREIIALYMKTLYRPSDLLDFVRHYPPHMLWKMVTGTRQVRRQYLQKAREARG